MKLDLGTEIRYASGERAGFLRKVVIDGQNVTAVVMGTGEIVSRTIIVPINMLYEGDGGITCINIEPDQLEGLYDYEEDRVPAIGEGWNFTPQGTAIGEVFPATMYEPVIPVTEMTNVTDSSISMTQGTEVWCLEERWGTVDKVLTDETGRIQVFVGQPDDIEEAKLAIPIALVSESDANRVVLNCTLADITTYAQPVDDRMAEPDME